MSWQELTSWALDQVDADLLVLLPIAAIEQQGPHLPLPTVRLIADHWEPITERAGLFSFHASLT